MKKVFSVFMIFLAVFFISCSGLQEGENSSNTVRITMPGNARSASAGGAEDVDYYNIQIDSQRFSNVQSGSTVESAPLPVGMSISISVEAIGRIKENGDLVGSGRRVAYYQTTQTLPAGGLTLSVNMANYKMEYHKVTLSPNGFGGRNNEEVYVAGGSSYTLPNYGTDYDRDVPQKHTGWRMFDDSGSDNPSVYPIGASVTITGRTEFELVSEDFATPPSDTPDQPATEQVNITFIPGFVYDDNNQQAPWQEMSGDAAQGSGFTWGQPVKKVKGTAVDRPTIPNYTFLGWIEGTQVPTGGLPSSYVTTYTGDMTLSAIWKSQDNPSPAPPASTEYVNITFEQGFVADSGASWTPMTGATLPQNGEKVKGSPVMETASKPNYQFLGWIEGTQQPGDSYTYVTTYTGDMTLSAIWEPYAKLTFNDGGSGFENQTNPQWISGPIYVRKGSQYTLPNYGTYTPAGGPPIKHISWRYYDPTNLGSDIVPTYQPGETVTITSDMEFELDYSTYSTLTFVDSTGNFSNDASKNWKAQIYWERSTDYTLPDYGTYDPDDGSVPKKHTGWTYTAYGSQQSKKTGETVYIEYDDMEFTLTAEDFAMITFEGNQNFMDYNNPEPVYILPTGWKSTGYAEKGQDYTPPTYDTVYPVNDKDYKHIGWTYYSSPTAQAGTDISLGESVNISDDARFVIRLSQIIPLTINSATNIILPDDGSIFTQNGSYFVYTNQPFTLPKAKKQDGSEVTEWTYSDDLPPSQSGATPYMISGVPGTQVQYDSDWLNTACCALVIEPNQ